MIIKSKNNISRSRIHLMLLLSLMRNILNFITKVKGNMYCGKLGCKLTTFSVILNVFNIYGWNIPFFCLLIIVLFQFSFDFRGEGPIECWYGNL